MSSVFRKGGKLSRDDEMPMSRLIYEETRRHSKQIQAMSHVEKTALYESLINDKTPTDPEFLPRERALTAIFRALANGDITAFLDDKASNGIFRIEKSAWYFDKCWQSSGIDDEDDAPTVRQYRFGLLQSLWPKTAFGADSDLPIGKKRVGLRVLVSRKEGLGWLMRNSASPRFKRPISEIRVRKIYRRLSPAARASSTKQISRILRQIGIPRSAVEAVKLPDRPSRGPKPKVARSTTPRAN